MKKEILDIGLKYCGGCQSRFNRRLLVDEFLLLYREYNFENVKEDKVYDLIIVVSGCQVKCASIFKYKTRYGFLHIDSKNYINLVQLFEQMVKSL